MKKNKKCLFDMKKENGITLVALIITVIVMLILAGVSISVLTSDGGLFDKTKKAAQAYEDAAQKEADDMQNWLNEIDEYLNGVSGEGPLENLPDGSFDAEKGVNMPDISKLPVSTTKYVTWNYNETDNIYEEQISDNVPENWYDYDNGKWANIKTTANDLEAYWVWIPRFAYKLPESSTAKEIEVAFIKNNGTETVEGERAYYSTDTEITKDGSGLYVQATEFAKGIMENNEQAWIVHPAFTFGDKQLNGIWVAKYEASNPDCTDDVTSGAYNGADKQVEIKPNVTSWRNIQVANSFTACENMTKTGGVIGTTNGNNNIIDTHIMKNIEWGVVAVLSQSKYGIFNLKSATGINGDKTYKVWNNSNNSFIIGTCGSTADASNENITNSYNTINGVKASTTGTVYGIYDMAGGTWERVMGLMAVKNLPNEPSVGVKDTRNTGFIGKFSDGIESTTGIRDLPESKYYDIYNYNENVENYDYSKIGDLIGELKIESSITWNDDLGRFAYYNAPVFLRSCSKDDGSSAGIFSSASTDGNMISKNSFRPVLILF